jgi:5'-3' exoribonuclease 2
MGVPSFFRWVSLRYPRVVTPPDPEGCDNLYIDLNGVIHPCFHPEDGKAPETEEECFAAILAYIDEVISVARPRKLVYVAVDGPAPRAKMNQQRSRRYRAANEAEAKEMLEDELREQWSRQGKGQLAPQKKADSPMADSNVITPGTGFMSRLGRWLRHWAYTSLNEVPPPRFRVILSDATVPGEGEHKVMGFIRAQRHSAAHDPNTRHCIHGLDADLIMLGLATHEPHFTILREVQRRKGARGGGGYS